jgi:hypothetical protein
VSLSELPGFRWLVVSGSNRGIPNYHADGDSRFAVNIPIPKESVEVKGNVKIYLDTGGSGKSVHRHFCANCGS